MGKKRIDKITRITNNNQRKVSLCKRKKGLLKKTIELSVLCDLKIFLYIQDQASNRVTHYASHPEHDLVSLFNQKNQREFYTNKDYERVGGIKDEIDSEFQSGEEDQQLWPELQLSDQLNTQQFTSMK